jgi:transposase
MRGRPTILNEEQKQEILNLLQRKIPQRTIAKKFSVSQMTISKLKPKVSREIIVKDSRGIIITF